jgi:hypothetical protein
MAIFQMLDAAFVSLFHIVEQVLHLTSPCRFDAVAGLSLSHTRNVLGFAHSPPQLVRNSSTRYTP